MKALFLSLSRKNVEGFFFKFAKKSYGQTNLDMRHVWIAESRKSGSVKKRTKKSFLGHFELSKKKKIKKNNLRILM